MKITTTLLTIAFISLGFTSSAQDGFKWDKVIDSLDGDKSELFLKTNLFISEVWRSAQDVVQYRDKEAGVVLIKGLHTEKHNFRWNLRTWNFRYTIKFMVKDNKARIIIDDVHCSDYYDGTTELSPPPLRETYPKKKGKRITGLRKDDYLALMRRLKEAMSEIVFNYMYTLKNPSGDIDSDW